VRLTGYLLPSQQPDRLGSAALTVGPYTERERGPGRGFDTKGVRLDLHHTPHDTMTKLSRNDGISVAIPEDIHKHLHRLRDRYRMQENTYDNVTSDFELLLIQLAPRGYTREEILNAREEVHTRNDKLGVYDGTKRDASSR